MIQQQHITTFYDMVEYLLHYASMDPQRGTVEDCRRAVVNGYREFNGSHNWSFLFTRGRINTTAPYSTGTIQYTDSNRQMTLTGGVWPSWAALGEIRIGNIPYTIASRDSDTQVTLSKRSTIGADVAAGTAYLLYRDKYTMPVDYQASYDMIEQISGYQCSYVANQNLLFAGRVGVRGPSKPTAYGVISDPHYLGSMAAWMHPIPDAAYAFDFIYHRRPRYIVTPDYSVGRLSVTNGAVAMVGNGTDWRDLYAGSIIRIGSAGDAAPPTSLTGAYPYRYERTILSVESGVGLTVDEQIGETLTNVFYRISDPIDVEDGAFATAFHRECEKQLRLTRRMRPLFDGDSSEEKAWQIAYRLAREADKRSLTSQVVGGGVAYRRRLADMPYLFNA